MNYDLRVERQTAKRKNLQDLPDFAKQEKKINRDRDLAQQEKESDE